MKKYFHQVMLDLIKQDAFIMEVGAYDDPWLPEPAMVIDAFDALTNRMFDFWDDNCTLAIANYVKANEPILFCKSDVKGVRSEKYGGGVEPAGLLEWLYDQLNSMTLSRGRDRQDFLVAPYVVQTSSLIEGMIHNREESVGSQFGRLGSEEIDNFLYTRPALFPKDALVFPRAYYSSALVAGVVLPDDPEERIEALQNLSDILEVLSIKFQMSWGYPQLLKEKAKIVRQKAVGEQQRRLLERFQKANDIARQLALALGPAFKRVDQLNRLLRPLPQGLFASYQSSIPYIPEKDHTPYFQEWTFMHDWLVDEIRSMEDSFRAQIACILLAYTGSDIPQPITGVSWHADKPWRLLKDMISETDALTTLYPQLNDTLSRVVADGTVSDWCSADVEAFLMLKGCFYYPFKLIEEGGTVLPDRLTGPLLALWALQYGEAISLDPDVRRTFFTEKARQGDGWPALPILQEVYSLLDDLFADQDKFPVTVRAIVERSKLTAVSVTIRILELDRFERMREAISNFDSTSVAGEWIGNFRACVDSIRALGGVISCSMTEPSSLEMTFSIIS